jgi:hypothetical protein
VDRRLPRGGAVAAAPVTPAATTGRETLRDMRILLIDHGCCDHPHTRIHRLREGLEGAGCTVAVCGPSTVPGLEVQPRGMHGIHLHDVAAASRTFLAAVRDGSPRALLEATAGVSSRLLGLARETARQMIAEAADAVYPDAIFVLHAGILTDLAVETGAPVVVHVDPADLEAAAGRPSLRRLVTAAIGSSDRIIAADDAAAAKIRSWLGDDDDTRSRCEVWPFDEHSSAPAVAAACRAALARRRGEA